MKKQKEKHNFVIIHRHKDGRIIEDLSKVKFTDEDMKNVFSKVFNTLRAYEPKRDKVGV